MQLKLKTLAAKDVKETKVFKLGFEQAMEIFEITKTFPKEETYSLTDQVSDHHEVFVFVCLRHIEKKIPCTFCFQGDR